MGCGSELPSGAAGAAAASAVSATPPQVDLYRLVPLADGVLAGEEHVMAHLPDSSFGCADIEEVYRQRDDAELRYCRARDALIALAQQSADGAEAAGAEEPAVPGLASSRSDSSDDSEGDDEAQPSQRGAAQIAAGVVD